MDELKLKYIYKQNKDNLISSLKSINKGEPNVRDVLELYEHFFRFLDEMYLLCGKQEEMASSSLEYSKRQGKLQFVESITKELEEVKQRNKKVRDLITKYSRVFPIYLKKYGVIVSENIECFENPDDFRNKYFLDKDDLWNYELKSRILGNFEICEANGTPIVNVKKGNLNDKERAIIDKILNLPVDKSKIPSFLNTYIKYSKLTYESFIKALEESSQEYDKLTEESKEFIKFENLKKEKEFEEERVRSKEEQVRQRNEKIEQLKMQMLSILTTLDSMNDELNTKIQKYPVSKEVLFKKSEDGVTRIDERFIPVLKYIDLSGFGFENVDISGIDFSDCNVININPQKVFNKDLSNTIFVDDLKRPNNIFPFNASSNFEGVNLSGSQIIIDKPIFINFKGAITDSETVILMNGENIELNNNRKIV